MSSSNQFDDLDNMDLYTAEEPTTFTSSDAPEPTAERNTGFLLNDGAVGLSRDLEEEAQLSLAIQYSLESSHWTLEDEEKQLQEALELSKKMMQHEASSSISDKRPQVDQLKKGVDVSLEDTIKAANTIQLDVFAVYNCDLIRVDIAFKKKVSQKQVEEKLEHRTLGNMSEYHRKCLEMIKRKHGVKIQVEGTIIAVSGFQDFVTEAVCDVKLLLDKMSNSLSDQEILSAVKWVYHDPVSSETPYSPDTTVFLENVWRMKLKKIDILLNNKPHIIKFDKMEEYNISSGKSVKISRKLVNSENLDDDVPGKGNSLLCSSASCFVQNGTHYKCMKLKSDNMFESS